MPSRCPQQTRYSVGSFCPWPTLVAAAVAASISLPASVRAEEGAAAPTTSAAISKAECAQAFEQSQVLRNSFKYLAASAQALRCASLECGPALSEECNRIYGELQAATPSIVLAARTEGGGELREVSVRIDGGARHVPLDGTPLLLDPGNHEFRFSAPGFDSLAQQVVILAGERFRPIIGVLKKTAHGATRESLPNTTSPQRRRTPLLGYALGGVGVLGFAGFVGFRVAGAAQYDDLAHSCKPVCTRDAVDSVRQKYALSYVALGLGAAASATAVTLYLTAPSEPTRASATLRVERTPDGVAGFVTTSF